MWLDSGREINFLAMSIAKEQPRHSTSRIFEKEVLKDPDVCQNCYRLKYESIHPKTRYYHSTAPERIQIPRPPNTIRERGFLFCKCGHQDTQDRPRLPYRAAIHAKNLSRTLEYKDIPHDREVLVETVRILKTDSELTGREDDVVFPRAVRRAVEAVKE